MAFDDKRFNRIFSATILIGMAVMTILATFFKWNTTDTGKMILIVSAIGSIFGVLSTVCAANGRIATFLFGFFDVTIYAVICFISGRYGNAALHALYFVPMQIIGFSQWKKRGAGSKKEVKARRFTGRQWAIYLGIFALSLIAAYLILNRFDHSESHTLIKMLVLADAFSTVCNILGQYLMSNAYMNQWFFWIGVNVSSIIMWSLTLASGESYALIYVIKYSFYLINAVNGLRIWLKLSAHSAEAAD